MRYSFWCEMTGGTSFHILQLVYCLAFFPNSIMLKIFSMPLLIVHIPKFIFYCYLQRKNFGVLEPMTIHRFHHQCRRDQVITEKSYNSHQPTKETTKHLLFSTIIPINHIVIC